MPLSSSTFFSILRIIIFLAVFLMIFPSCKSAITSLATITTIAVIIARLIMFTILSRLFSLHNIPCLSREMRKKKKAMFPRPLTVTDS